MSDRKYRQPEQRRVEERPQKRYGTRGQQASGQTGQQSSQRRGQEFQQTGGRMEQSSGRTEQTGRGMEQTSGRMERSGGGMGRQSGQQGSQMGQRSQMGQQSPEMGRQSRQMGGQQSQGRQRKTPIRPVTVSDLVATDIVTARPDDPVTEVVQKMATEDVGSVVIVQHNRPIGIVTDRKITLALGETPDVSLMQVSDLMTEDVFTVSEDTNVFDLIRNLSDRGVRRVPVVDDQENLRGIVSLDDVIVLLAEEFHNVGQIIRKQSPRL